MATELYCTLGGTTVLAGGYTAGSGVLNVVSTVGSPLFPASGNFRLLIQDQATNAVKALLLVTAIASATQFTVVADGVGIDNNALAGDPVLAVITADAWDAIRSDQNQVGLAAALPSVVGQAQGNTYSASDTGARWVLKSGAWVLIPAPASPYKPFGVSVPFALPNNTPYSWINQSGATLTVPTTPGSIILQAASGGTDQVIMRARSYPVPPFILTMQFVPINIGTGNFSLGGMAVADSGSTPKIIAFWWGNVNGLQLRVQRWNNPTSNSGTFTTIGDVGLMPKWFQIEDNNTNLIFRYSFDGINFLVADTQARTAFLTAPAQIGFCVNNLNTASKVYLVSEA